MSAVRLLNLVVVWGLTLALGALCVAQWLNAAELAEHLDETRTELAGTEAELGLETRRADRLTETLLETEAGRIEAERRLERAAKERALLKRVWRAARREADELGELAASGEEWRQRGAEITSGIAEAREALAGRDATIQRLEAERVQLAEQLNERTRQYNQLVESME